MGQSAEELRREIEQTRMELGGTVDTIGDRVSPARVAERQRNRMRDGVTTMRERVMGSVQDRQQQASDRASGAADTMHQASDAVRHAPDTARAQTQGNPLAAGLVAFGIGALAGAVFPGTRAEGRAVRELRDRAEPLQREASQAAQEVTSSMQERGQEALQEVKGTAQEGAQHVKDSAQQEAQRTADTGTSAAKQVKDDASSSAQQVKGDAQQAAGEVRQR